MDLFADVAVVIAVLAVLLMLLSIRDRIREIESHLGMSNTIAEGTIRVVSDDRVCGMVIGRNPETNHPELCTRTLGHSGDCLEWEKL